MPNQPSVYTRTLTLAILLLLVFPPLTPAPAKAQQLNIVTDIQQTINQLNPINIALGGLIDQAIAKGDGALQRRLEQLQAIIQSAITQLDQALKNRIDQADTAAQNRIRQSLVGLNQFAGELNVMVAKTIEQISSELNDRILQAQTQLGNVVAGLPFDFDPLPNAGRTGLYLVKQAGSVSTLFVTGVGLFKKGDPPTAWLGGHQLLVPSYSMGLIELAIPNALLPDDPTPSRHPLKLRLRRGNRLLLLKEYVEPVLPLFTCGRMVNHRIRASLSAKGQVWERQQIRHPAARSQGPPDFYIETNSGNTSTTICAQASPGWEVDTDIHNGDKWRHGLFVDSSGGGGFTENRWTGDCYTLYCDVRWGNCNSRAYAVYVAQKKLVPAAQCASPVQLEAPLNYGLQQFRLDFSVALGPCVPGLSVAPEYSFQLEILDPQGTVLETRIIAPGQTAQTLAGALTAQLAQSGLLDIEFKSSCRMRP